jgi:hypothetical protein
MANQEIFNVIYSAKAASLFGYNIYETPEGEWVQGTAIYPVNQNWRESDNWGDTVEVGRWIKGSGFELHLKKEFEVDTDFLRSSVH